VAALQIFAIDQRCAKGGVMTARSRVSRSIPLATLGLALACCLGTLAALPASAATTGSSSAYGESIDLSLVPLLGGGVTLVSGPLPVVAGTAAPSYDQQTSLANVRVQAAGLGTVLQTGILNVAADSSVPAADQAHGHAEVANPALQLASLLGLNASVISSDASISGGCGSGLTTTGTTQLLSAQVSGLAAFGLTVPPNPAPNTELLNLLGVRVILNEQIAGGDGFSHASLTVNAVHVSLTNSVLSLIGVLSGDIVISQSRAEVDCGSVIAE
jgi:hypothetical protein